MAQLCTELCKKENVGWADPSVMQSYYSAGTMIALIVTAPFNKKNQGRQIYPLFTL